MKKHTDMKKILISVILVTLSLPGSAFGRRNHATVNFIAFQHLNAHAKAAVNEILQGETFWEHGSYPDDYRLDLLVPLDASLLMTDEDGKPVLKGPDGKPFCYGTDFFVDEKGNNLTTIAHGWYASADFKYVEVPYGECVWYIRQVIGELKNWKKLPQERRFKALVVLAHLVGDMHCPTHIHYTDKWDGNDGKYNVEYGGRSVRYHSAWDTNILVDRYQGGPLDFATSVDPFLSGSLSKSEAGKQLKAVQDGTLEDWCAQISEDVHCVYEIKEGDELTAKKVNDMLPLGRKMVCQAGYRLAKILNDTL